MEQIPTEVMEIATMSNGLQVWKIPNKEVGGFIYYSEENGAPLPALCEALISIECLEIILNDMKKTQGLASPCALCEGKEKEIGYQQTQLIVKEAIVEALKKEKESQSQRISELESEKERLKGLIKSAHYAGWYNGMVNAYKHEFSWDEFSKLNNL